MKFKSLKIKNFKQFIDEEINFSTDTEKNITLISGANATGKTTIIEAMKWCLFGECNNSTNNLLNKKLEDNMNNGDRILVEVVLILVINQIEYSIKRTQIYEKSEQVKSINCKFDIISENKEIENLNLKYLKFLFFDESSIFYRYSANNLFQFLNNDFSEDDILKIKSKSKKNFNLLISRYGRNIKDINGEYQDLALGERILLGFSIILSIQNYLSEKNLFNFKSTPLIIDSVLGALDSTKRDAIFKTIPFLTNQFIVLCKDIDIKGLAIIKKGKSYLLNPIAKDICQTQILEITNDI